MNPKPPSSVMIRLLVFSILWLAGVDALAVRQEVEPAYPANLRPDGVASRPVSAALTGTIAIYLPLLDHGVFTVLPRQIAFETTRDGDYEIYLMNPDGSQQTNLTRHPGGDGAPAWSPDGRRIAFASSRAGSSDLYIMDRDGTDLLRLTDDPGWDTWPTWSPDGLRIAFMSDRDSSADPPRYDIYVINADGTGLRRITSDPAHDRWPAWSPDGTQISFTSNRLLTYKKLFLMSPDGSNVRVLSDPAAYYNDFYPTWSPEGRITFGSERPAPSDGSRDDEIYLMDSDGSNVQQLTDNDAGDWLAHWSPDGTQFVFYTDRDAIEDREDNKNIYVKTLASGQETRITDDFASDEYPAWSP